MAFSDTRIHQIELLLTLDYLLNYTDENHPASHQDICRHATHFGLKYDAKAKAGNDVRRQRISDCLKFLMSVTDKFPDEVPFVLETTASGKYYIEQKHFLSEEQVIKILAAVQNDKYTQDEDTEFLIERLLDSLSNAFNREHYKEELSKLNQGVKKYNFASSRKIRLVTKAFRTGKSLKIRYEIFDKNKGAFDTHDILYRVYKIKEYKNKPYALLIPISTGKIRFYKGFIFDAIENLNIPKGTDREVLCDDEKRDLDKLFKESSRWIRQYDSPEEMIEESKMPVSAIPYKVSFYFRKVFLKFVKPSFEEFFSTNLECIGCTSFDTLKGKDLNPRRNKEDYIIPHPLKKGEEPELYVVNTFVDSVAFMSWLMTDVHGIGINNISDMIVIVGPELYNNKLYEFYLKHARRYENRLHPENLKRINESVDRLHHKKN